MPTLPALPVHRVTVQHSRQLIGDARTLIAAAKALIAQSRQSLARQSYLRTLLLDSRVVECEDGVH
jgi:hypothetical protein